MQFNSGTGTHLKVGWGEYVRCKVLKIYVVVPIHFFALQVQLVVFGKCFCDAKYSFVSFLVFCSTHGAPPPVPSHL